MFVCVCACVWMHTFPNCIGTMQNANRLLQDLKSLYLVHFLP